MSEDRTAGRTRAALAVARAVAPRPRLWGEALSTLSRLAPERWWRHPPFLPVPDADYWRFRMHTAYGDEGKCRPTTAEVVDYLQWCQRTRRWRR